MRCVPQALMLLAATCAYAQNDAGPPAANPARPTVTNPATLPPVGYLQFEQGYAGAWNAPETQSQQGIVQTAKLAVHPRLMVQVASQPYAHSRVDSQPTNDAGDLLLGSELVAYTPKESEDEAVKEAKDRHRHSYVRAATPTVTLSYQGRVKSGTAPDLDSGSSSQSVALFASGHLPFVDVHYDTNFIVNEQSGDSDLRPGSTVRRAQFGQTFSFDRPVSHNQNFQLAGEVYYFSQPFVHQTSDGRTIPRANLCAVLFAGSYSLRPNLVVDSGVSRGLTSTTTHWQVLAGFTYLLPKRLWPEHHVGS